MLCVHPSHSGVLVDGLDVLAVVLETSTRGHGIGAGPTGACRLVGCGPAARRVLISQISNLPPYTCAVASSYVPGPTQGIEKMADDKAHPIYLGFAIGAIAVGVATGCIFAHYTHTDNIEIAAGFTALALIYILTQAIERVNELLK